MSLAMVDVSRKLYSQSSKLRAIARMLAANGDGERPDITFTAAELDGFSSLLISAADNIDSARDNLSGVFPTLE